MLKFDDFKKILNYLEKCDTRAKELDKVFQKYDYQIDFVNGYSFVDDKANNIILYLLEEFFNDHENKWIKYWTTELNYGMSWKPGMITDFEGHDIKLATVEDLWNLLMTNLVDGVF